MRGLGDDLRRPEFGDQLSAEETGKRIDILQRSVVGGSHCYVDATGVFPRPAPAAMLPVAEFRWGKLDGALRNGASDGSVDLWQATGGGWEGWDEPSGQNQGDVYAPPWLTDGEFPTGAWVLIAKINGRWVVEHCFVKANVVVDLNVDGANAKLEQKRRLILVTPRDDAGSFEVYHPGNATCPA